MGHELSASPVRMVVSGSVVERRDTDRALLHAAAQTRTAAAEAATA
jgi:N-acetylglucosaminyldiphosphoundecaprenol N-acetyl-beta-D-mannosaminyltransferase